MIDFFLKFNQREKSLLWATVACYAGGLTAYPILAWGLKYPDTLAVPVMQYFFRTGGVVLFLALALAMWRYMRPVRPGEEAVDGAGEGAWDPAQAPRPSRPASHGAADFEAVLTDAGENKIAIIKVIREVTGLGLKEAKDIADATPSVVKAGLSRDAAREVVEKLEREGAKARVNLPAGE